MCLILALVAVVGLAACGSSSDSSDSSTAAEGTAAEGTAADVADESGGDTEGPKVGMLSPFPANDGGITELSIKGAEQAVAEIPGAEIGGVVENASEPQAQVRGLRNLASSNDIVVGTSGELNQAMDQVAPQFPDVTFIQLNSATEQFHDNVTSVVPQLGLPAIVAGAVMANRSESGKLGVVAGLEIPASLQEIAGVTQGAELVNQGATVASTFTGDYNDVGKAKQGAEAQMADGVDQILGDLDSGIRGVEQAATASGADVYQVFGIDCKASDSVVGSDVVDFTAMTETTVTRAAAGELKPGALFITLASPELMRFEFCPGRATPADEKLAEKVTKELSDGQLEASEEALNPDPGYESVTE